MSVKFMAAALLSLSIMGCAQPLRIETAASGAPVSGTYYRWLDPEAEAPHLSETDRARLEQALAARGLRPVSDGGKADYLLLVDQARRPAQVGLARMDPPPAPGSDPDWMARPDKRGKQISSLNLRLLDPATGEEKALYAAHARHGKRDVPIVLDRLIDAILAPVAEGS